MRREDAMDEAINGNLSVRAAADTTRMEWTPRADAKMIIKEMSVTE